MTERLFRLNAGREIDGPRVDGWPNRRATMRVLITGVSGYLGRKLCASLAEAGHEVVGTSREPERVRGHVPGLTEVYRWTPQREALPREALKDTGAIIHLVGEAVAGRWNAAKKGRINSSRMGSTQNVVRGLGPAPKPERPAVMVSASAVGYYGDRGDDELTEADGAGHDFLGQVCLDWEGSSVSAEPLGLRVVRMRMGFVIGRGSPFMRSLQRLFGVGLGGRLGSGDQWWSWVHVDDAIGLMRFAIEHDTMHGPVNTTAPAPVRQRDFARALGRAMGRPAVLPAPAFALRLALGEMSEEVLNSRRVLPKVALEAGYKFVHPELDEALRDALGKS